MIDRFVVAFDEVGEDHVALVGGKGASLGALSRLEGINVPAGFCVTTEAFRRIVSAAPSLGDQLDELTKLDPEDRSAVATLGAEIRRTVETITMPDEVAAAIVRELERIGVDGAVAVRSSATAEDAPAASFAGQHDSYLNLVGRAAVLGHVSRCWASLFTDRAIAYRRRHGIDDRSVHMAVVVQRMVAAQVAGVLFTADPVTGNRRVATVEATFGLGDALVAGRVDPDVFTVCDGIVGTPIESGRHPRPALSDRQVLHLVQLGRRIEARFGHPQDVEWCLVDDEVTIVQSRPITTLFPIPAASDGEHHVFVSVGHQQMMTDPIKPFGISMWQLTAGRPMFTAGGRLFVDVTQELATPSSRARLLNGFGRTDPLTGDALRTIADRADLISPEPVEVPEAAPAVEAPPPIEADQAIVDELIERTGNSIAALRRNIEHRSGAALFDFILADIQELKRLLVDPQSMQVILAGMSALWWLNDHMKEWLDEANAADALTQSAPNNVTSEMGLALLDVADAIRPHPDVVAFLQQVDDELSLGELDGLAGGREARNAIEGWLDRYGMRCVGEIDITRPRWSERPATLVPVILGNVENFAPGEASRRFEQGRLDASERAAALLERVRALPDGIDKADETARMIDRLRTFSGFREYPKYGMVCRYFIYKQALLREAEDLVRSHVLAAPDDIHFLTFEELHDAVRTRHVDEQLIARRKDAFESYRNLSPPRVLTSDGEAVSGAYRRNDTPPGALVGLAVSSGTVEGRARVVLDIADADLEPGDVLVTTHTDPSWTPVFVAVAGLVTEVGGLMTHGAVIAREYGLQAVVGVEHATQLIRDGQRIRVHGTDGYVELLP